MQIEAFLWIFLPVLVAGGSALLSYYIMVARMEVAVAKERETLAEARAIINSQKTTMEERVRATEEATKRRALDDFMQDLRVEERSYVRESKSLQASRKSMVLQERLFFRNIPLSNWIEHEMILEEGRDLDRLAKASVFAGSLPGSASAAVPGALPAAASVSHQSDNRPPVVHQSDNRPPVVYQGDKARFLDGAAPVDHPPVLLTNHASAFGAQ